ncbi:TlpA family protein disulfide reductase [Tenacibaculum sp. UWU-22]|uniref:TlpA family protein disulfide reductase n=1 Tax=Tenacibaculum sp. UWU-22 TaxID=3234187 RepID=UPI0034DB2533
MKKIIIAALTLTLVSCSTLEKKDYALFSGTIKNPNSTKLTIVGANNEKIKEINVSKTGVFADTLHNVTGFYMFSDGVESSSIYLKNGDDLKLTIDTKQFDESIVYTGKGSKVNNFLAQKYLITENLGSNQSLYSLGEATFLKKATALKDTLETALKGLDTDFATTEKKEINYDYIARLANYENAHKYYTKDTTFTVSNAFPNPLKNLDLENEEEFKNSSAYKGIVVRNFYKKADNKAKAENIPFTDAAIALIKNIKGETIKNTLLYNLSYEVSASNKNAKELYNDIIALSTDEDFKLDLTKKYNIIKSLVKGNNSPTFKNYENNAGGTSSLEDFKGKYVYIDVWATWCAPCKAEIPFLKEVEKKYHKKNIAFVSISVDTKKTHDKWKKMIVDKDLKGTQLIADNDWDSDFIKNYGINGIPRFILIDPEGKIITADAPRPSDKELIDLFNDLKI